MPDVVQPPAQPDGPGLEPAQDSSPPEPASARERFADLRGQFPSSSRSTGPTGEGQGDPHTGAAATGSPVPTPSARPAPSLADRLRSRGARWNAQPSPDHHPDTSQAQAPSAPAVEGSRPTHQPAAARARFADVNAESPPPSVAGHSPERPPQIPRAGGPSVGHPAAERSNLGQEPANDAQRPSAGPPSPERGPAGPEAAAAQASPAANSASARLLTNAFDSTRLGQRVNDKTDGTGAQPAVDAAKAAAAGKTVEAVAGTGAGAVVVGGIEVADKILKALRGRGLGESKNDPRVQRRLGLAGIGVVGLLVMALFGMGLTAISSDAGTGAVGSAGPEASDYASKKPGDGFVMDAYRQSEIESWTDGALPVPWELMGGMAGILTDHAGKGPYPSFADDRRAPNHPDWSVFEFDKPPIAPTSKDPTGFQDGGLGAELINPKQIDKMHDPSKDQCSVGGKAATGLACTAGGPGDLRPGSDGGGVGVGPTPTSVLGPVSPIDCLSHPDKYHHDPSTGLCTGPAATTTTTGPDNQDPLTPQGDNSQALGPAPQTALPMRLTASVSPAPSSATTPPTTAPAPTTTGGGPLPGISDTAGATPSTTTPAAAGTGSPTTTTPGDRIGPSNPFGGGLGAGQQQPAKLPRDPGNWDKIDPQGVPEAVNYIMRQLQVRAWQELNCPQMAAAGAYTAAHPVPAGTHPSVDQLACADWSPAPAPVANDGPPGAPPPSGATPTTQPTNASTKSDKPTGPTSIDDLTSDRLAPPNDAFWERILNDMIYQRYACPPERWTGADPRQPEPASPDGSAVVVLPVPCPAATYHDGDPPPPQCPAGEQPPSEKCSYPPPPRLLDPLPPLPALGHRIIEEGWRLADFDAYASLCPTDSASSADGSTLVPAPGPSGPGSPEAPIQANNARTIIGIAKTENLGKQGALIGLMAGLGESTLTDEANRVVPPSESYPGKEADPPPDGHSVGIMQQQPNYGWSTIASGDAAINNKDAVWQIMTQAYAAEAFFGSPPGSQAPPALAKGLQNVAGWQTMTPAEAAAKVQGNRDGWRTYAAKQEQAQRDLDAYYDDAQPVALPVPLNGGPAPSLNGDATSPCQSDNTNAPSIDGCKNPFVEAGWATARTDQGVDYVPQRALPVRAICDGTVLDTAGHGWPGGVFILLKLTSGPFTGKCAYVAEHLSNVVPPGTHVAAGDVLGTALPGSPWTEWGWAAGPGTPSVRYGGAPDGTAMAGGKAFARFLRSLGAPTRDDPGQGPLYEGASCA